MIVGGSRRLRDRLCQIHGRRFYLFINRPTDMWASSSSEEVTKHIPTNHLDLPIAMFQNGEFVCPWSADTKKNVSDVGKMIWNKLSRDLGKSASFLGIEDTTQFLSSIPVDISAIKQEQSSNITWVCFCPEFLMLSLCALHLFVYLYFSYCSLDTRHACSEFKTWEF